MTDGALLTRSTAWLLHHAARRLLREMEEALGQEGLRWRDYSVLGLLEAAGGLSQQEIGRRLGIDRSTMVHVVDELEGRGLVVRRRDDADRRAYTVALTDAGHTFLRKVLHPMTDEVHERVIGGLAVEEKGHLDRVLARLGGG